MFRPLYGTPKPWLVEDRRRKVFVLRDDDWGGGVGRFDEYVILLV